MGKQGIGISSTGPLDEEGRLARELVHGAEWEGEFGIRPFETLPIYQLAKWHYWVLYHGGWGSWGLGQRPPKS